MVLPPDLYLIYTQSYTQKALFGGFCVCIDYFGLCETLVVGLHGGEVC